MGDMVILMEYYLSRPHTSLFRRLLASARRQLASAQEASITTLFRSEDGAKYTPVHLRITGAH